MKMRFAEGTPIENHCQDRSFCEKAKFYWAKPDFVI
jgi:hypothetical protein